MSMPSVSSISTMLTMNGPFQAAEAVDSDAFADARKNIGQGAAGAVVEKRGGGGG